jgi:hypothetical protein
MGENMKKLKPNDIASISTERRRIAKIFKTHIDKAIAELGAGYNVTLQGKFDETPVRIEIEINAQSGIP